MCHFSCKNTWQTHSFQKQYNMLHCSSLMDADLFVLQLNADQGNNTFVVQYKCVIMMKGMWAI